MNGLTLFGCSCAVAATIALGVPTEAAGSQAGVRVTGVVVKYARLKVVSQPASVVLTPEDISRGYIEFPEPTELAVQSNSPDGYVLEFANSSEFASETAISGLNRLIRIGTGGGGSVQEVSSPGATRVVKLAYRFHIAPGTQAGLYPWPMRLSVTPL